MYLNIKEGEYLVRLARNSIAHYLESLLPLTPPKPDFPELLEKKGVFCTLLKHSGGDLRGCIGIIESDKSLINGVIEASCSATQDPRFIPLTIEELDKIVIEITVLSDMQKILVYQPRDYLNEIKIREDGLFIKYKYNSGIFLPQVPVEHEWDLKTYLCEICLKAGLDEDAWIMKPVNLYKFQAQIFSETEPRGGVFEKKLKLS